MSESTVLSREVPTMVSWADKKMKTYWVEDPIETETAVLRPVWRAVDMVTLIRERMPSVWSEELSFTARERVCTGRAFLSPSSGDLVRERRAYTYFTLQGVVRVWKEAPDKWKEKLRPMVEAAILLYRDLDPCAAKVPLDSLEAKPVEPRAILPPPPLVSLPTPPKEEPASIPEADVALDPWVCTRPKHTQALVGNKQFWLSTYFTIHQNQVVFAWAVEELAVPFGYREFPASWANIVGAKLITTRVWAQEEITQGVPKARAQSKRLLLFEGIERLHEKIKLPSTKNRWADILSALSEFEKPRPEREMGQEEETGRLVLDNEVKSFGTISSVELVPTQEEERPLPLTPKPIPEEVPSPVQATETTPSAQEEEKEEETMPKPKENSETTLQVWWVQPSPKDTPRPALAARDIYHVFGYKGNNSNWHKRWASHKKYSVTTERYGLGPASIGVDAKERRFVFLEGIELIKAITPMHAAKLEPMETLLADKETDPRTRPLAVVKVEKEERLVRRGKGVAAAKPKGASAKQKRRWGRPSKYKPSVPDASPEPKAKALPETKITMQGDLLVVSLRLETLAALLLPESGDAALARQEVTAQVAHLLVKGGLSASQIQTIGEVILAANPHKKE